MNELASRYQGYLVGQLIAGFIALMMVLFGDFGGYYYRTSTWEAWGVVALGTSAVDTLLVVCLAAGLAVSLYATISSLQGDDVTLETFRRNTTRSVRGALFTAEVAAFGAVVFVVLNFESTNWWFDMGFYAALIGGAVVGYLGKLVEADLAAEPGGGAA